MATLRPDLIKEWHPTNNGQLTPCDVFSQSNKKYWWICCRGHEWMASPNSRNNKNSKKRNNCPYCAGKKPCKENCLATINSSLSELWHPTKNGKLTPHDVTPYSHMIVYWKCKNGHEWRKKVAEQNIYPQCRECMSLAFKNPKLADEWHPTKNGKLIPHNVSSQSNRIIHWQCQEGHDYKATVANRNNGSGCPYCSGRVPSRDNCLAVLNPKLASEWNFIKNGNLTPYDVCVSTNKKVYWRCSKCYCEWDASPNSRDRGTDCPDCCKNKIKLKGGDICDSKPEAYYWLKLENNGIKFKHHISIGLGRCVCDFYIPSTNTYIEITSFNKKSRNWRKYYKQILKKRHYITKILRAKFKFIQLKLTPKQIQYVKENMA